MSPSQNKQSSLCVFKAGEGVSGLKLVNTYHFSCNNKINLHIVILPNVLLSTRVADLISEQTDCYLLEKITICPFG
jgi:hypothetical protein